MRSSASIFRPIRNKILIIGISLLILLVCLVFWQNQTCQKNYEDKVIINIFGKQRMLSQQLSKDANNLYAIIQAIEAGNNISSVEVLNKKMDTIRNNIIVSEQQFSDTLEAMHTGYLEDGNNVIDFSKSIVTSATYIKEIDTIWEEFQKSLLVIKNADSISKDITMALIYINDNNELLLSLSDQISNAVLNDSVRLANQNEYIYYTLIILLILISTYALYQLIKYIILPFNQLFRGIHKIGLSNSDEVLPVKEVTPAVTEIKHMFHKINNLISLIENINNNGSFMETLEFINRTFSEYIPYSYIGIAMIDKDSKSLHATYGVTNGYVKGLPDNLLGSSVSLEHSTLGKLVQSGEPRIINDLEEYTSNKPMSTYNKIIMDAGIRASITMPLKVSNEPVGVIFFSSHEKNVYRKEHIYFLKTLVNSIAISLNQNIFINDLLYSDIIALAKLAEARDEDTGEHLERMKQYSKMITRILYENKKFKDTIDLDYIERIERFSPLHDIGKVGISDHILLKPGKLTDEEFEEMKKHTTYGAQVLKAAEENLKKSGKSLFSLGIEISASHHEKWNGSGYPYGLKGNEIPLSARIVAIADVLDALTSRRPYKEPFPFETSIEMIKEGCGTHFDPEILSVVLPNKDRLEQIYIKYQAITEIE